MVDNCQHELPHLRLPRDKVGISRIMLCSGPLRTIRVIVDDRNGPLQSIIDLSSCVVILITFCVSRRRRKMYCGHARLCVSLSVCLSVCLSAAVRPHYCTDPDVAWGHGRGCPLVVHYWADLQSGHGLRCYGNITRTLVTSLRPSRDMTT